MTARFAAAVLACLVAAGPAGATDEPVPPEKDRPAEASGEAVAPSQTQPVDTQTVALGAQLPIFLPPPRGSPKTRVGGTSRGADAAVGAVALPQIEALVPSEVGQTASESPVLYFHLSKPTRERIDFTLIDPDAVRPLVERSLPGPLAAGVHRIDLAELGVRLRIGVAYPWFVALVPDPEHRESDVVAGGAVERIPTPGELAADLASAPAGGAASVLAHHGLWYDALDDVSRRVDREPEAAEARRQRTALLEQVGLGSVVEEGTE